MSDASLRSYEQQKRTVLVLGGCRKVLHELMIAPVLAPLEILEPRIRHVVEVVSDGVGFCAQTILGAVLLEVGLNATPCQLGMECREHETPARAQRVPR